ncbi:hypothetical protein RHMOL_Rhmol01G0094700 [Rhododendron molle]|uniref:Uncharacterized protein n=1 Tax=Rhododendron molle TaxID=49168 RepID=A0ACC0PZD4_RHOML|nr:hypothetical protein RHMOL_Rhmol01G0094700 [Rhododendron molle]
MSPSTIQTQHNVFFDNAGLLSFLVCSFCGMRSTEATADQRSGGGTTAEDGGSCEDPLQLSLPHRCLILGSQGLKKKLFTLTWECSTCSNVEFSGLDIGWGQRIPMKFDEEQGLRILQRELLVLFPCYDDLSAVQGSKLIFSTYTDDALSDSVPYLIGLVSILQGQNPLFPGHTAPAVSEREKAGNVETAQQIGKMK